MNWQKFKERFPLSYPEIFEYHKKTGYNKEVLILNYFSNINRYCSGVWIRSLDELEAEKQSKQVQTKLNF